MRIADVLRRKGNAVATIDPGESDVHDDHLRLEALDSGQGVFPVFNCSQELQIG